MCVIQFFSGWLVAVGWGGWSEDDGWSEDVGSLVGLLVVVLCVGWLVSGWLVVVWLCFWF